MRKPLDIAIEMDHTATTINRAVGAYKKAIEAISPDLKPEVAEARRKTARDALDAAVLDALRMLEPLKGEAGAAVAELRDPEAALLKAAASPTAPASPGDALLAQALPGLSPARLLDLAERGGPALVLLARQELRRKAEMDQAAREAVGAFDELVLTLERFGRPDAVKDLVEAHEQFVRAEIGWREAVADPREGTGNVKIRIGHELAAFRRAAGLPVAA